MHIATIGLDAGHGGRDRGTQGGGIDEAGENLRYCFDLAYVLRQLFPINVVLLRKDDRSMSFAKRNSVAKAAQCSLILSEHINAHENHRCGGFLSFYWPGNKLAGEISRATINAMPHELATPKKYSSGLPTTDDGDDASDDWLQPPRTVVGAYRATAVLNEGYYATNAKDRRAMGEKWIRDATLLARAAGVARWLQMVHPTEVAMIRGR